MLDLLSFSRLGWDRPFAWSHFWLKLKQIIYQKPHLIRFCDGYHKNDGFASVISFLSLSSKSTIYKEITWKLNWNEKIKSQILSQILEHYPELWEQNWPPTSPFIKKSLLNLIGTKKNQVQNLISNPRPLSSMLNTKDKKLSPRWCFWILWHPPSNLTKLFRPPRGVMSHFNITSIKI